MKDIKGKEDMMSRENVSKAWQYKTFKKHVKLLTRALEYKHAS